jgi:hypothetical protein
MITVEMKLTKTTPGTYRYDATNRDAVITSIYVKKAGYPDGAPEVIKVQVASATA